MVLKSSAGEFSTRAEPASNCPVAWTGTGEFPPGSNVATRARPELAACTAIGVLDVGGANRQPANAAGIGKQSAADPSERRAVSSGGSLTGGVSRSACSLPQSRGRACARFQRAMTQRGNARAARITVKPAPLFPACVKAPPPRSLHGAQRNAGTALQRRKSRISLTPHPAYRLAPLTNFKITQPNQPEPHSLRKATSSTKWLSPLVRMRPARWRVGWMFSCRLTRLIRDQIEVAVLIASASESFE